jgi:hypothetical protein
MGQIPNPSIICGTEFQLAYPLFTRAAAISSHLPTVSTELWNIMGYTDD